MNKTKNILKLMRVKHYLKNFLVVLPLFFSGKITLYRIAMVALSFIVFCLFSSAVYILNDLFDYEKDRLHPKKCMRPLASNAVSKKEAAAVMVFCLIAGLAVCCVIGMRVSSFAYPLIYLAINILYSVKFKHVPILDIALLTSGFIIRVLYGGAIIDVEVSAWLYLTIMSIAFYMALGKRKKELEKHSDGSTRSVLKEYNTDFLNTFMNMSLTLAIVFYSLWAKNLENSVMMLTVPLVILIAMKYSLDINRNESDGDPIEVITHDVPLIIMLLTYALITGVITYLPFIKSIIGSL